MSWIWLVMAGIWSMDRVTAFNFMLSRPLVVSALIGAVTGNFYWCLAGGVFFEVMGLIDIPVGTRLSVDDTFGAFAYCLTIDYITDYTGYALAYETAMLAAAIAFIVMFPVGFSAHLVRWFNKKLYIRFKGADREGLLILVGQAASFLRGVVIYTAGTVAVVGIFELTLYFAGLRAVRPPAVIAVGALVAGYFIGFFHTRRSIKAFLFAGGALLAWVLI